MSAGVLTRERLQWGLSMLLSRLARLVSRDGQECCVPWADMLNHAADARCHLDWNPGAPTSAVLSEPQIGCLRLACASHTAPAGQELSLSPCQDCGSAELRRVEVHSRFRLRCST